MQAAIQKLYNVLRKLEIRKFIRHLTHKMPEVPKITHVDRVAVILIDLYSCNNCYKEYLPIYGNDHIREGNALQ